MVVADETLGAFPPAARVVDGAVSYALPVDREENGLVGQPCVVIPQASYTDGVNEGPADGGSGGRLVEVDAELLRALDIPGQGELGPEVGVRVGLGCCRRRPARTRRRPPLPGWRRRSPRSGSRWHRPDVGRNVERQVADVGVRGVAVDAGVALVASATNPAIVACHSNQTSTLVD